VEVKRQDLLIRAFAALQGQGKHASLRLLIVGDGEERTRLEKLAFSLGVGERTIFAGYQAQPENFFQAMDLFVLTSRHEGLPLALLEAWASGLCVVSSSVGAIPQTVTGGVNGVLFPSGNRQALTDALARLLDDPELMGRLGRAGRARVGQEYSLDQMAAAYERRYRSLVTSSLVTS
ncbi:MAG: glycosyltransferase family 4 protein, partial [Pirellulaceae bacterium]